MSVYVRVCMCAFMHVCVYVCTYACVYACLYACVDGWITTPKLNDLSEECLKDTGVHLFKTKGVQCTTQGRQWLQRYLFRWGNDMGVSVIFCLGWNSNNAPLEYRMQVALVTDLQNSL